MIVLVGDTGFVGSNLKEQRSFDYTFNSRNIQKAYGLNPEILVYAGVRGTKFIANQFPDEDSNNIKSAMENIKKINPKKLILISTVDVYDDLNDKDENYLIDFEKLHVYGKNRYILEQWVMNNFNDYHIIRLPAIYGRNLKKNYIHDLIDPCPLYISRENYLKFLKIFPEITQYYREQNGLFKLEHSDKRLINFFKYRKDNAIAFTDSRSSYQYFNLKNLDLLIKDIIKKNISLINIVTPPIISSELYRIINGSDFINEISLHPIKYNLKTIHTLDHFVNKNGYLLTKDESINDLIEFIRKEREKV